jgi:flagella synthesis protein FlgN
LTTFADTVPAALAAEVDCLRDLLGILRIEQDALRRADADALAQMVPDKVRKLDVLGRLAQSRSEAMRKAGFPGTRLGVEAWLATVAHGSSAQTSFRELLDLAATARGLNTSSKRLATMQYRHFERAGTALRRAGGHDDIYGADGRPQHRNTQRVLVSI